MIYISPIAAVSAMHYMNKEYRIWQTLRVETLSRKSPTG
jgi:hypothetical protein